MISNVAVEKLFLMYYKTLMFSGILTLLHSEGPKLYGVLAILSATGLISMGTFFHVITIILAKLFGLLIFLDDKTFPKKAKRKRQSGIPGKRSRSPLFWLCLFERQNESLSVFSSQCFYIGELPEFESIDTAGLLRIAGLSFY